jgi:hypothetical protein
MGGHFSLASELLNNANRIKIWPAFPEILSLNFDSLERAHFHKLSILINWLSNAFLEVHLILTHNKA